MNRSLSVSTPLAGILSSCIVLMLILLLGFMLTNLPMAVVSGSLMLVGIGMIKPGEIRRLFSWRGEFAVFAVTLFSILFLGLQTGLIIAIVLSILLFVLSASRLKVQVEQEADGIRLRVEGHLFYASIDQLGELLKRYRSRNLVLDLSVVSYLDMSATEAIAGELSYRDTAATRFDIVLTSPSLLEHFEQCMGGMPVRVLQRIPT